MPRTPSLEAYNRTATHLEPPRGNRPVVRGRREAVPVPVELDALNGRYDVWRRSADSWQDAVRCGRLLASELPQVRVRVVGADQEEGAERVGRQSLKGKPSKVTEELRNHRSRFKRLANTQGPPYPCLGRPARLVHVSQSRVDLQRSVGSRDIRCGFDSSMDHISEPDDLQRVWAERVP